MYLARRNSRGWQPRTARWGTRKIRIGDSRIMLADEFPEWDARSPQTIGGSAVHIMLYVEDVDAVVNRAVAAGAKLFKPVADQFYGDRSGSLTDPFGHKWTIATHKEDVSPEEMKRRASALFSMSRDDPDHEAEPSAAPNGGPATPPGNSGVTEGPPSVS